MRIVNTIKHDLKQIYGLLGLDLSSEDVTILTENDRKKIESFTGTTSYEWFIGVEKEGFLLAAQYALQQGKPYLYYSLELYTRAHPLVKTSPRWQTIHKLESKYLKTARAVVIQDQNRADVFLKDYGLPPVDLIFIPISLEPSFYRLTNKSIYTENEFDLIQLGVISKQRYTFDLVDVFHRLMPNRRLLIHGYGEQKDIQKLQTMTHSDQVTLSLDKVDAHDLPLVIGRAKVGLALYAPTPVNDRLTIKSSEKIPLYLMCGKPVITFDYEGCELLDNYHCGATIHSFADLPAAFDKIIQNYAEYSQNALRCFDQVYRYEKNAHMLVEYLKDAG